MSPTQLDVSADGEATYRATMPSGLDEGTATVTLRLLDVASASDGRLHDDEATAAATFAFLLEHQDAADLPPQIDIGDVVAAYDGAVDRIASIRG